MSISYYSVAVTSPDEEHRQRQVQASAALQAAGDPVLDAIVLKAKQVAGTQMAGISIASQDWLYFIAAAGLPTGPYRRQSSFCDHALSSKEPTFTVLDAELDERFVGNPFVEDGTLRSYVGVQLFSEQLPIGMLCVFDPEPRDEISPALSAELAKLAFQTAERLRELSISAPTFE
ncbi:GAF domain-containing protein [Sphingomonas aerophila]|jgi:GAF domain-containing protein|uniref:GAF domain-containing protein n=1 Tax=Sphingomonas aerophila TaxID=1344948 RepID=A0A7W9BE44_9SPHN|nr:GAF domain-containing protein [Sphingomonas aerophila]MBB5715570.1 GAF domain-containing protein [Sphingomonas aerophila]